MCLHDKSTAQKIADILLAEGTATHMSVLKGTKENGNYVTSWFVKVSDRQNIANTMQDMEYWHDAEKFDFTNVNLKRAQFNLPELSMENLQEPDRDPQPHFDDTEIARIWKERDFPGEEEAKERTK